MTPISLAEALNLTSPHAGLVHLKPIVSCAVNKRYGQISVPFSVIIPVKNEATGIRGFMRDLAAQTARPTEIFMVDGNSIDDTCQIIREESDLLGLPVTVLHTADASHVKAGKRATLGGDRNYAIRRAKTDLLVFTDAGNHLPPDFFANLLGPLLDDEQTDLCGGIYRCENHDLDCDWSTRNWQTFLPACRCMAIRRHIALRCGMFPEFLSYAGEDTLFDIWYRRFSSQWVFNQQAVVWWDSPESGEEAWSKFFRYGVGDGENGVGDWNNFYRFARILRNTGELPEGLGTRSNYTLMKQALYGYIRGKTLRGEIDRTRRGVGEVVLLTVEKPLHAAPSSLELVYSLAEQGKRVVCLAADSSCVTGVYAIPPLFDADLYLCDIVFSDDFLLSDFLQRYGWSVREAVLQLMEDPWNTGERARRFQTRLQTFFHR